MSPEELRKLLRYDPETGKFFWLQKRGRVAVGYEAGTIKPNGYRCIKIGTRNFYAHRLAWLYVTGAWPENQVDHENCNTDDNRFANLREATGTQNQGNRKARNGRKGITYHRRDGVWQAQITVNWKSIYLGQFKTEGEAMDAYRVAARKHFGDFARFE
jgi:hypothetical protein